MAAPGEKSFCVLEYHTSNSVVTVQREFRAKCKVGICASRNQLIAEDDVKRVGAIFLHSPKKSTGTSAKELSMSETTVWRVLRTRLVFSYNKFL
jgi:hypothetical protein